MHTFLPGTKVLATAPDGKVLFDGELRSIGTGAWQGKVWYLYDDVAMLVMQGVDPEIDPGKAEVPK